MLNNRQASKRMLFDHRQRPWKDAQHIKSQPQSTLISALPRELRDEIWSMAVIFDEDVIIKPPGKKFYDSNNPHSRALLSKELHANMPLPPFLNTCQQIRSEATQLYYANNTFRCIIHDQDPIIMTPVHWLESLSKGELHSLQHIIIELVASPSSLEKHTQDLRSNEVFSYTQMCALFANFGMPLGPERYIDRANWNRMTNAMSWVQVDHGKVVYEVGEKQEQFKAWLGEWRELLERMRGILVENGRRAKERLALRGFDCEYRWEDEE